MLELLSPAGSYEAVVAAVQSGADSVYLGFGSHNARRGAQNFTDEEFEGALRYCRARGCGVYVTINTLISDREMPDAVALAKRACELGASSIILQDVGLARVLREAVPDIALHASTQMSVHNLAGVEAAAELGISRVILARELTLEQLRYIGERSPIELEIFVHGALCVSYSGQCYMSALVGRRSGNRGMCAGPCRQQYSMGGRSDDYPLSLRDNCLIEHLTQLERAGIRCVKIEGRMRRPEYVAIATRIYANAIKNQKNPTEAELEELREAFSRNGFTDSLLTGKLDEDMFGTRGEDERISQRLLSETRRTYQNAETRRVPVDFYAVVRANERARFAAEDHEGRRAVVNGPVPEAAVTQAVTEESVSESLYKTGGTPFRTREIKALVEPGLFLPVAAVNDMRRKLLLRLLDERSKPPARRTGEITPWGHSKPSLEPPVLNIQIASAEQLTPQLAEADARILYVPLKILTESFELTQPFTQRGTAIAAVLPRVFSGEESAEVRGMLRKARALGVREALVGNMGHIRHAALEGFKIRGDFGLNAYNSWAMDVLSEAGFLSATASFELRMKQVRDMGKPLPVELIAYGRLPAMITRACVIKRGFGSCACGNRHNLSDRMGALFPVMGDLGCRNVIYNSKKLFLADRSADYGNIGLWGIRLMFTTENSRECAEVARAYKGESDYVPNGLTRGLYYRGVE